MSFDVIIVGGGPAGVTAAVYIAKAGNKVLLIDKREEKRIGNKVGGGVVKIDTFSGTGFPRAHGDELISFIDTFNVYSPTAKTKKTVSHTGMEVDRLLMNQRLLGYAKAEGVTVMGNTEFKSLNLEDDRVIGITVSNGDSFESKIVVDASGINGVVRRHLPDSFKIEREINPKYVARAYVELLPEPDNSTEISSFLAIYNGNIWKTPTEIGYGSFDHSINLKEMLHEYAGKYLNVKTDGKVAAYGEIAVRQNLSNMVGNGFVAVGDSACMVSPMDGAGVATSMIGAKLAAEVINECLAKGEYMQEDLWKFNVLYNRTHGAQQAYMDMLRRGVIGLPPEDIDFAFKQDVVTNKDILDSITGDISKVSVVDKAQRALRGIRRPSVLLRLESCVNKSKDLKAHYSNFPNDIEGLDHWLKRLNHINDSFTGYSVV